MEEIWKFTETEVTAENPEERRRSQCCKRDQDYTCRQYEIPVFTANADEAIFRYPGTNPYYNPYYNARPSDWNEGNYFTVFFMDKLNAWSDPRRAVWSTTCWSMA